MGNASAEGPATVAGYRLLRRLGGGRRADVYLGAGRTGSVAVKVFAPELPRSDAVRELDVLARVESPHAVRLIDVDRRTDEGAPVLVLQRVSGGSVARMLAERSVIDPGELVTMLAPVAALIPVLHRSGVGHGAIDADHVHLGARGEPILIGFGASALFEAGGSIAAIDDEPIAARDRVALAELTAALLSRVRGGATSPRVGALREWLATTDRSYEFCERLEERLFELAEPLPLRAARSVARGAPDHSSTAEGLPDHGATGIPARVIPELPSAGGPPRPERPTQAAAAGSRLARIDAFLDDDPLGRARERLRSVLAGVRRPFRIAAVLAVVAIVSAIALLSTGQTAPPQPVVTAPAEPGTVAARPAPRSSVGALPSDPVAAIPLLLASRNECVRELSVDCLADVDDEGSTARAADVALIQQLESGSEPTETAVITSASPSLVETVGDGAILSLGPGSTPASVLMIKTEAGWRLRGYLTGEPLAATPSAAG